jgi:hypothetical protein
MRVATGLMPLLSTNDHEQQRKRSNCCTVLPTKYCQTSMRHSTILAAVQTTVHQQGEDHTRVAR